MKRAIFLNALLAVALLSLTGTGCKKKLNTAVTPIPAIRVAEVPPNQQPEPPRTPTNLGQQRGQQFPPPALPPANPTGPDAGLTQTLPTNPDKGLTGGIPATPLDQIDGMNQDTNHFAGQMVFFDYDSATVKRSETSKVNTVGDELKGRPEVKLLIDGHCDERGTEEYNRALGERRALSLREYLVSYGLSPDRIRTRSWGEDRPLESGHDESAWSKNRRGEFILLLPPGSK